MHRFFLCLSFNVVLSLSYAQNTGIATTLPTSTLDVNGSMGLKVTTITSSTTLSSTDAVILCNSSSSITATLPTAVGITGRIYTLKNINTGSVTIAGTSGQTLDGYAARNLTKKYQHIQLVSNGANWNILEGEAKESIAFLFATDQSVGHNDFVGIGASSSSFARNSVVSPLDCELNSITLSIRGLVITYPVTATIWVNNASTALYTVITNPLASDWSTSQGSVFITKGDLISIRLSAGGPALSTGVTVSVTYH